MVAPCSYEAGDTRVFVNIQGMVRSRHLPVKVRTVHTNVVPTGLEIFQMISGLQEL